MIVALGEGEPLITVEGFPFEGVDMTKAIITASFLDVLVVAVVNNDLSLNSCGSGYYSFW